MEENNDLHNQNPGSKHQDEREENTQDSNVSGSQEQESDTQDSHQQENQEKSPGVKQSEEQSTQESEQKSQADPSASEEQEEYGQEKDEEPVQDKEGQPDKEKQDQALSDTEESKDHADEKQEEESAEMSAGKKSGEENENDSGTHPGDEDIYGHEVTAAKQEEEEEEEEELDEQTFHNLSREELLAQLEEAVQAENVNKVKNKISLIKVAFIQKTKDKKQQDYEQFVEKGAEDEEFVEQQDDLEKRFNEVFDVYRQKKAEYNRRQEEIKQQNLEKKKAILERLRELINSEESLKKTYDEFKELQSEWKKIGMVPRGDVNELWKNYHFLVEKFFDKVKINKELRDLGLKKNLQKKVELCESAEELLLENDVNKAFKLLQKYHQRWKEIGPVPREYNESIWQRFKSATDKINERRREFYRKQYEKQEENYKAKLALCEKAEALAAQEHKTVKEWLNSTDKINELFRTWRSIGRAPVKKNDEVWERFRSAMDLFFKSKKAFFKDLKQRQRENYNKKLDIIKQAEALKDSTDWKNTKEELIRLQKEWKQIGPVPKKHADKIWKRFRAACDHFFNRRDEHFKNLHKNEEENLQKKEELIEQVKNFEPSGDKEADIQKLKEFQRQWMEIGFVPIKQKDRVQKEFKEAIDKHFHKLKVPNVEKSALSYRHKLENIKEEPNANQKISKEKGIVLNKIKKLKEDIQLWENNIGFLAETQKSNQLREEFERKIEKAKQELALQESKLRYLDEADDDVQQNS
ncbi:MAG: DUF349 domain-containing protein [Bacteroidales bacterium]|nr:DUF349 domain-containing protein [Bacteroidales bacterium]MCF8333768.1 DUF349 domain-containing protein [Bacteroidales bacterium]